MKKPKDEEKPRRKLRPGQYLAILISTAMRLPPNELEQRMLYESFPFNRDVRKRDYEYKTDIYEDEEERYIAEAIENCPAYDDMDGD